eukprot:765587-Amphidinium_carterae.1
MGARRTNMRVTCKCNSDGKSCCNYECDHWNPCAVRESMCKLLRTQQKPLHTLRFKNCHADSIAVFLCSLVSRYSKV